MNRRFRLASLLLVGSSLVAGSAGMARGDDPKPTGSTLNLEAKKEKPAALPDFAKLFELPFESTATLGHRLTEARMKCDPIALALIATEIGIAEKVSGKTADITAADLKKEAVELAMMRRKDKELSAMALMVHDESTAKKLTELASTAKKEEAERVAKFKSGERDKGIHVLIVRNTTPVRIAVRINGMHLGWVPGNSTANFNTSQFYEPESIYLSAHDEYGDVFRTHAHTGHHHYFTWTLNDN